MRTKFEILSKNGERSFVKITFLPENDSDKDLIHKAYIMSFDKDTEKKTVSDLIETAVMTNGFTSVRKFDQTVNRQGEIRLYVAVA